METKNENKFYGKQTIDLLIGIPVVGILISFVMNDGTFSYFSMHQAISALLSITITAMIWIGCRYIVIFLWDKYPWEKFPMKHLFIEIAVIIVYTTIVSGFASILFITCIPSITSIPKDMTLNVFTMYLITFFNTSIYESVFFYKQWKFNMSRSEAFQKESLRAQYETLKTQVNPHFLFNSFNTLITLIEDNQKTAQDYVQKLSDYFREILELREKELITISDELEIINTYYFLQKQRYGSNLVLINHINPTDAQSAFVAPLSLQMLVENAIKHNIISREKPLQITMSISNNHIVISNNFQKRSDSGSSGGLGLENIRNRYDFLTKEKVVIEQNNEVFSVKIPIIYRNNPTH